MWDSNVPIQTDWRGGPVRVSEVLYEVDAPTIFTALVGFESFLFFKIDELEDADIFIACPISGQELVALKEGRISVRAALSYRPAWMVQTSLNLIVEKFQERSHQSIHQLLPPSGVPLMPGIDPAPDSLVQADALLAFKFIGQSMSPENMLLSTFKEHIDQLFTLVRQALLPRALAKGRNNRFFDVQILEPTFASLLLAIKSPEIDELGLREYKPTKNLSPDSLRAEALQRGHNFWDAIEKTTMAAAQGDLDQDSSRLYKEALHQIAALLPSSDNELDFLEVTYHGADGTKTISINKTIGDRLVRAGSATGEMRTIEGVIIEENGEAKSFIIKDAHERQTTCKPTSEIFDLMDKASEVTRGTRVSITGRFVKRERRDYISTEHRPRIIINP